MPGQAGDDLTDLGSIENEGDHRHPASAVGGRPGGPVRRPWHAAASKLSCGRVCFPRDPSGHPGVRELELPVGHTSCWARVSRGRGGLSRFPVLGPPAVCSANVCRPREEYTPKRRSRRAPDPAIRGNPIGHGQPPAEGIEEPCVDSNRARPGQDVYWPNRQGWRAEQRWRLTPSGMQSGTPPPLGQDVLRNRRIAVCYEDPLFARSPSIPGRSLFPLLPLHLVRRFPPWYPFSRS